MDSPRITDGRLNGVGSLAERLLGARDGALQILALTRLRRAWPEIVGERLCRGTWPLGIAGSTLRIATDSASWSHALSHQHKRLLERLRRICPEFTLDKIKIEVVYGRPPEEAAPPPPDGPPWPTREELAAVVLSDSAQRSVDRAAAEIRDDDLRAVFGRAFEHSQKLRQWCLSHGWSVDARNSDLLPPTPSAATPPARPPARRPA